MEHNNLKMIREYWGVNNVTMSKICGFGVNQWREYEQGKATPNKSNGLILLLVSSPYTFRSLLKQLPDHDRTSLGSLYGKLLIQANKACSLIDIKVEEYRNQLSVDWIK